MQTEMIAYSQAKVCVCVCVCVCMCRGLELSVD